MIDMETCFVCGGQAERVRELIELSIANRKGLVEAERFRCKECGETFFSPEQLDTAQRELARTLREQEGLLAPEQIRALREQHALTQAQLERLLGVGAKTVVRWERGTVFQSTATDRLLRVIGGVPGALRFLAETAGLADALAEPASQTGLAQAPPSRQRMVKFIAPAVSRTRPRSAKVMPFRRERRQQMKSIRPRAELDLPPIPLEAMR
jgi:HTH-type transcriptional regulator / antitoxin MqsA